MILAGCLPVFLALLWQEASYLLFRFVGQSSSVPTWPFHTGRECSRAAAAARTFTLGCQRGRGDGGGDNFQTFGDSSTPTIQSGELARCRVSSFQRRYGQLLGICSSRYVWYRNRLNVEVQALKSSVPCLPSQMSSSVAFTTLDRCTRSHSRSIGTALFEHGHAAQPNLALWRWTGRLGYSRPQSLCSCSTRRGGQNGPCQSQRSTTTAISAHVASSDWFALWTSPASGGLGLGQSN
jgi:hypothetical protein